MQLVSNTKNKTSHNHCLFSLSATRVTTRLGLKPPTCFCSGSSVILVAVKLKRQWLCAAYFGTIEANCISNLSPNHTLQLTIHRTSVRESLPPHFTKMMLLACKAGDSLTNVQWSLYLQYSGCCCTDVQWLLTARCWL